MKHYLRFMITLLLATVWSMGGYAQETVTDELTATSLKLSSSYSKFSNITLTSDAVYSGAGYVGTGKSNYGIQIKSGQHKNSFYTGIVSSTSGGKIKTITIEFNKSCTGVNVYGNNTAYESADDLFNSSKSGVLIQKVSYNSSEVTVTPNSEYKYVGICSTFGTVYIDKITIVWEKESSSSDKTSTALSFPKSSYSFATTDDLSSFTGQKATLTAGDETLTGKSISYSKDDTNNVISTLNEDGTLVLSGNAGTAKVTATFGGDNEYASSTASYTISVKPVVKDIATLKPQITSTDTKNPQSFTLKLTDAVVTYVNKNTAYVQDATAGIYVYASGHNLENNQKINGLVDIGTCLFNGLPEIASWTLASDAVVIENATFDIETVTLAELTANYSKYESKPVKVAGAVVTKEFAENSGEISQDGTTYVVYNKGGSGVTLTEGDNIDIIGYPAIFNGTKQLYLWKQSNVTVNYSQVATTLSLDPATTEYTVEKGKETAFTAPTVTVKDADDNIVEGAKVTYKSSNTNVATVDSETGNVTFGSEFGTTTITASYAGDATHKAAKDISYTIIYGKVKTTMAWSAAEVKANIGQDFTAPTLSLTADGESILDGKTITYESSEPTVAEISETGVVTIKGIEGTTNITAKFAGDDTYAEATAQYTLTVVDPNKMEVTFDFSSMGYDNAQVVSSVEKDDFNITLTKGGDNEPKYYTSDNTLRIYTGATMTMTAPKGMLMKSIGINAKKGADSLTPDCGEYTGTATQGIWSGASNVVAFTLSGNLQMTSIIVTYSPLPSVTLDESSDNTALISENAGKTVNVTMTRTISKDYLNPICLPFAMDKDQIAEAFGEGSKVYTLNEEVADGVIKFDAADAIEARTPYILEATNSTSTISLNGVTFAENAEADYGIAYGTGNDAYSLQGVYSPFAFTATDGSQLFVGKDNNLYKPSATGQKIKGFRAYFTVEGDLTKALRVSVNGGTSSIDNLMNGKVMTGKVYNLNGQFVGVSLEGLAKGVYVMNGKKYVVK